MKTIIPSLFFLFLALSTSVAQINYWHQTNGPEAGTLREMSIDSSGRIILWTGGSGVYQSSDKGNTWHLMNKGLPDLHMSRGASGGPSGYLYGINLKNQVFRFNENVPNSVWKKITPYNDTANQTIYDILADPNGAVYLASSRFGVFRSDDNGLTWMRKNVGIGDSISKTFHDSSVVCLTIDGNGNIFAASGQGTILRSTNKGDTWTKLPTRDPDGKAINALLATKNGNIIIGNFGNRSLPYIGGKIYVSRDTGKKWDSVYQRPPTTPEVKNNIEKFIRVPGSNVLYAAAHGITLRSIDNGVTWIAMDSIKRGDEPFSMGAFGNDLYEMSEPDGIFYSVDNGISWAPRNKGLYAQLMWGLSINSKQELFGITEYGLFRSTNSGDAWDQAPEYGETYFPSLYINKKDYLYIGTNRGLFRSKDNGTTLDHVVINLDPSIINNIIVQVGANDKGKLFCACLVDSIKFITSTDDGDHWLKVTNLPESNTNVNAFAFASKDTILIATNLSAYYRSIDDGDTWKILSTNNNGTGKLLIHPDGSYLALVQSQFGGILRSTDEGQSWLKIFPPPADFTQSFAYFYSMMVDSKGRIIVCTDSGIWRSVDTHYTEWLSVSTGLTAQDFPGRYINASQVVENPVTHIFFAASRGLSVFKSIPELDTSKASVAPNTTPVGSGGIAAFPNPFPSMTNISFTLEKQTDIHLDVYDLLGRHIKTLTSGIAESGEHIVTFDASSLPTGSYAIVLRNGESVQTSWVTHTR